MSDTPKVSGSPDVIWLVYGGIEYDCDHSECDEVLWCEDSQYPSDVRYVRSDIAVDGGVREAYDALWKEKGLLLKVLKDWLEFAADVQASDAAGQDWLDGLKARTARIVDPCS